MKENIFFNIILIFLFSIISNAQNFVWTGAASDNNFFTEENWKDLVTNKIPDANSINPSTNINFTLLINSSATIVANGVIQFGTGSLALGAANLSATSVSGGNLTMNENGYLNLSANNPFLNNVQINFTSGLGWIKTPNYKARAVSENNLSQIKVNNTASVYKTNLRLDHYYLDGCVIRANLTTTTPLIIYDDSNSNGNSAKITVNTIHSGEKITASMNNKIKSFVLKKGFMATFAVENDGTGKSKNYIASEEDLTIQTIPKGLLNNISFIRVLPWNWVSKKGRTDDRTDLNTSWRYKWNHNESSSLDVEFAPMAWGGSAANDDGDIAIYVGKYNSTHAMGFNESDNCNGQSGQYGNPKLCVIDEAVRLYKNLMKTGMRLVSPNGTEGAATGWLKDFRNKANQEDVRIDVIGVHWYDWGSNPASNPNPTPTQVFNRFKTYLTNVYKLYGLPIWITEFNANPHRNTAIQQGFMDLALPYLETLDYVERYNWFQPNPTPNDPDDNVNNVGTGEFYTTRPPGSAILTSLGTTYKNQISTPSIPNATVNAINNLNLVDFPNIARKKTATANSSYKPEHSPAIAVDGVSTLNTSQWIANIKVSSETNYAPLPAWIEVDLKGNFTIDAFRIIETTAALRDFNFQVWDKTLNSNAGGWSNALTVTANPTTPLTTYKTFSPVTTTKIRLYITAHNSTNYIKINELEVYGIPAETLGTKQFKSQHFSLYPNPIKNVFLNIKGQEEIKSLEIYDILGAKMNATLENGKISVQNLASGVYFLKINKEQTIKFIKK